MARKTPFIFSARRQAHAARMLAAGAVAAIVTGAVSDPDHEVVRPIHKSAQVGFAYASSSALVTVNGASTRGVATDASRLSVRMYPGAFVDGLGGQRFLNNDLFSSITPPDPNHVATYVINPRAEYSDGVPVTCDDFYLSWAAQRHRDYFDSDTPLLNNVEAVTCVPGAREFTVTFGGDSGNRYTSLFQSGSVMPAHIVADAAHVDNVVDAVESEAAETLTKVGQAWNDSFLIEQDRVSRLVSAGPYLISSITDKDPITHGRSVTLSANPKWWGDKPNLNQIVVYPASASLSELGHSGSLYVADIDSDVPNDFGESRSASSSFTGGASNPRSLGASPEPRQGQGNSSAAPDGPPAGGASEAGAPGTATETVTVPEALQPTVTGRFTAGGQDFASVKTLSRRIDSLIPSDTGVMKDPAVRKALSQCVDRVAVATASGTVAGMAVPAYGLRLTPPTYASASAVNDVAAEMANHDVDAAREALDGKTIRLSYDRDNPRYAAMAKEIINSCQQAGATITDNAEPQATRNSLGDNADIFLEAVDPLFSFEASTFSSGTIEERRRAERDLWGECPTIPLAGEPRTLVVASEVSNLVPSTSSTGVGWNMDRWKKGSNK